MDQAHHVCCRLAVRSRRRKHRRIRGRIRPDGSWAQLFRTSPAYRGTELLRDAYVPGSYLTIDRWDSEDAFRAFRKDHDADYEKLDRACDALTARETRIGAYTA